VTTPSVFLLIGEEPFLKDEWLQKARKEFFKTEKDAESDYYPLRVDGDFDLADVISLAKTQPFLSKKRLIAIRNVEAISSPADRERLLDYIRSPAPHTVLVLDAGLKDKDAAADTFFRRLAESCASIPFKKLYDKRLAQWVAKQCALKKKGIGPQAIELLIQLKGNDLAALAGEIEKLALYAAGKGIVATADVEALVGKDATGTVYEIIDAMSRNDKARALALSLDFKKKELGAVTGLFCWNLRRIVRAKERTLRGWSADKVANSLGVNRFHAERFMSQVKRLKASWLRKALAELTEFDLKLKTAGFPDLACEWQMLMVRLLACL